MKTKRSDYARCPLNWMPDPETGCWVWLWRLCTGDQYPRMEYMGKRAVVHRTLYEMVYGPLDRDIELHHGCENTRCVNPDHMEPLTKEAHTRLHQSRPHKNRKFACRRGHEFTPENTQVNYWNGKPHRSCRTCQARWDREAKARRKLKRIHDATSSAP
jgi:hypothetical protein